MLELQDLRNRFRDASEFTSSPLYTELSRFVADSSFLLQLASHTREGQEPTFILFAAIHYLLLDGADHELAEFYPSIVSGSAPSPERAGPSLISFCTTFQREITKLLETRLVQTNNVKRSLALRLGLAFVHRHVTSPVHLIEIGASAGIHLRCDRYGYILGGRRFGDASSPVQIDSVWHGAEPIPDLDAIPTLASVTGIDLNPLSATNPDDRRWLEALVWPENRREARLLKQALAMLAKDPPLIHAGDAIDLCPDLAAELPANEPRVAFHSATRMHVPAKRLIDFDNAITALGLNASLWSLSLEPDPQRPAYTGSSLSLRDPLGAVVHLAIVDGHLEWVRPSVPD